MKSWLRVIGDVHGTEYAYLAFIGNAEYSIQVGDFDCEYQHLIEKGVDPNRHVFIGGNHEDYGTIAKVPHFLGDFGTFHVPDFGDVFFLRGAFSVDFKNRSIWPEEELSRERLQQAIDLYAQVKPRMLVSHECPLDIVQYVTNPEFMTSMGFEQAVVKTKTNQALQAMTDIHPPKVHCFGHYHRNWRNKVKDTLYFCVGLLQFIDFEKGWLDTL